MIALHDPGAQRAVFRRARGGGDADDQPTVRSRLEVDLAPPITLPPRERSRQRPVQVHAATEWARHWLKWPRKRRLAHVGLWLHRHAARVQVRQDREIGGELGKILRAV